MRKLMSAGAVAAALLLSGCAGVSRDAAESPYGFTWGQTPKALEALNLVDLDCTEPNPGSTICTSLSSPEEKEQLFMTMFLADGKEHKLVKVSRFSPWTVDQAALLADYDKTNAGMEKLYGEASGVSEEYARDNEFLGKIAAGKIGQFKRKYDKDDVEIVVGVVSNGNLVSIQDKKDLLYSVLIMYTKK